MVLGSDSGFASQNIVILAINFVFISLGIENSKSVIEAGLLIQSEAATYILTYTNLVQSLCCKQLVMSWQKITDLEKIIGKKIIYFYLVKPCF